MEEQNEIKMDLELEDKNEVNKGKKDRRVTLIILCISCLLNIYLANIVIHSVRFNDSWLKIQKLKLFKDLVSNYYYQDIDESKLIEGSIEGMVNAIDEKYTVYFNKGNMKTFLERTSGKYNGIGIAIAPSDDGKIYIADVFENSPAQKAGIKPGDKIIKVNNKDIANRQSDKDVIDSMKGEVGEEVILEVLRPSTNSNIKFKLAIANINMEQIKSEVLDDDIGYISIRMFDEDVSKDFKEHLERLKEKNIKALLLDLRNNPGGDYKEVISVADALLPKGSLIVYTEDKNKKQDKQYAKGDGLDLPIIVLVNKNSASASEVLSGALKDNNRAWLLGTKTYGKGVVQSVIQFNDGSGLKLTTAKYFTPSGECIQDKGIQPDYEVELPEQYQKGPSYQLPKGEDTQLKEALRIIKTKM